MSIVLLATFKAWVNDFNTSDTDLQTCLDVAESVVKDYLGYDPATGSRTEYLSGRGLNFIQVKAKNITTISSITVDGVSISSSLFRIDGDCIIYKEYAVFPPGRGNVVAVYVAGWTTIPTIIQHTIMRIGNIVRLDRIANGQAQVTTADGGTRQYAQYLKYDQQLAVLANYRAEVLVP